MRLASTVPALFAVGVLAAAVAFTAVARAGDDKPAGGMPAGAPAPEGMPETQKALKHPFIDCLLGSWTFTTTGMMGEGKGSTTVRLGVGGTALLEDYESEGAGMKFSGHGITKLSDDGKTVNVWWIDNMVAEPMKMSGPITDKGYEITGSGPSGEMKIKFDKTDTGLVFKMFMAGMDEAVMTATYAPAPK